MASSLSTGIKNHRFQRAAQRITGFAEKEIIFRDYQFLFKDTPSENSFTEDALTKEAIIFQSFC